LFDKDGKLANKGKVIPSLLDELNQLEFYQRNSPKSLGREWVKKNINPILNKKKYSTEDKLNTFCEHIAYQIGSFLKNESVLVSGGGANNKYLIKKIKEYTKSKIILPSKEIIDFKEAIIFAFLGVLRLENKNNCLKSVTGAKTDNCGGDIYRK